MEFTTRLLTFNNAFRMASVARFPTLPAGAHDSIGSFPGMLSPANFLHSFGVDKTTTKFLPTVRNLLLLRTEKSGVIRIAIRQQIS
jgi:hypothetical protein